MRENNNEIRTCRPDSGCTNGTFSHRARAFTIGFVMRLPLATPQSISCLAVTITVLLIANPLTAKITNGARLTSAPVNLRFGKVAIGRTRTNLVTMTNFGSSNVTVSQATVVGTGFSLSGLSVPLILTSGESITFRAVFTPRSKGAANGTIYIVSNASNEVLSIPLTGSATNTELTVTPAAMNFGNVSLGSYLGQNGTISASNSAVTISSVTSSNSEFTVSGLSLPITIPAGQYASFTVTFAPQISGPVTATITFADDEGNPLGIENISAGTTPPHNVDLSWNASTSQDVIGYNVYRANVSGGPYTKINLTLDPNLNYMDISVFGGETYYYVTTAVNSNNQESIYSNEVQAVIP
jgi:hypothetical protein